MLFHVGIGFTGGLWFSDLSLRPLRCARFCVALWLLSFQVPLGSLRKWCVEIRAWPRHCRKVNWTKMVQTIILSVCLVKSKWPYSELDLAFARLKWTKMVHFGPYWPEEVHFGPFRSANLTLAILESCNPKRSDSNFKSSKTESGPGEEACLSTCPCPALFLPASKP